MTYLELLQMVADGTQPTKVKLGDCTYTWDGSDYANDNPDLNSLSAYVGNAWTVIGQIRSNIITNYLTPAEKEWLAMVISPFASKVEEICKVGCEDEDREYIIITYLMGGREDSIRFPSFKAGEHFKGMVRWKDYSPKDLDL